MVCPFRHLSQKTRYSVPIKASYPQPRYSTKPLKRNVEHARHNFFSCQSGVNSCKFCQSFSQPFLTLVHPCNQSLCELKPLRQGKDGRSPPQSYSSPNSRFTT